MSTAIAFPHADQRFLNRAWGTYEKTVQLALCSVAAAQERAIRQALDGRDEAAQTGAAVWLEENCGMEAIIENDRIAGLRSMSDAQ